jgi:type I site-specific restriction endonuclease
MHIPASDLMTPEQLAGEEIDVMLTASGWVVQPYQAFHPSAARGLALREVPLKPGRCDYLLLVDRKALGVIEANARLEQSFAADQPRSLIQMATGAGKTYTSCAFTYRLIRYAHATSLSIESDDFDYAPFSQRGGLGTAHQVFGDKLLPLLDELNHTLAA